jgi:hypothetical protein
METVLSVNVYQSTRQHILTYYLWMPLSEPQTLKLIIFLDGFIFSYVFWVRFSGDLVKVPKLNSVAWVRERAITTERSPLVGEVSANFCG